MSRIGNSPITVPAGVTIAVENSKVKVSGTKGNLELDIPEGISVKLDDSTLVVSRNSEDKPIKAKHGLIRSLINNMIIGVSEGYSKTLEVNGVGFKVNLSGKTLKLSLGYSHEITYAAPDSVDVNVDGNKIIISGIDKQLVGQVAADIREFKKPEPYKGKGIKYDDEHIIRKAGKSQAAA